MATHERDHLRPPSAAATWPALARMVAWEDRLGTRAARHPATLFLHEFVRFGVKQAWACLFGGIMLALLLGTHLYYPAHAPLTRYDFLTLMAVAVQVGMLATGLETREEMRVILLFHLAGTVMELFKTAVGSWIYPEPALLRLGGVPLFTGFMYACVGSYLARAWRVFAFRFSGHPSPAAMAMLAGAVYLNFFTHHFMWDVRPVLFVASIVLFGRCWVYYRVRHEYRRMPMLLGLVLVTVFIWFAENLGTFAHAWVYPSQVRGWTMVGPGKLGAWYLLLLISYTLVASVQGVRDRAVRTDRPLPG